MERMRELGLFGTAIPEEHGGLGLDLVTYAKIVAEVSRAWISLSGVMNTHFMASWMLLNFGTREQQERLLPRMATGEVRGAFSITEPHAGSDVQAIKVRAVRDGDAYVVDGHKKWITNGLHAGVIMLLAVTDPDAQPRHRGFTCLVVEKEPMVHEQPGLTIPPLLKKMGYLGIDSTEMFWGGLPGSRRHGARRAGGPGLQAVHGRPRTRPGERRRARPRSRPVGVRPRDRVRGPARDVRQADRRPPVDPDQARADGDEDPRGRAARPRRGRAQAGRRARRPAGGDGEALRDGDRRGVRPRRAADLRRRGLLAGLPVERLTATRRCSSSARAPTRSSTSSSPGGSWRRGGTPR